MLRTTRRNWLAISGLASAAGALSGGTAGPISKDAQASARDAIRNRYFPNVVLTTHEGKKVRFYDDLIKDKIVVINLMYARCEGACPLITSNLAKVQKLLGERVGRDIFMYSITVNPEQDTRKALKDYARMHGVGPGWLFLTGRPNDIELLRRRLGFVDPNPEVDKDKSRHSGMVRYGNEPRTLWASFQGQAKPEWIVESISWVDEPKNQLAKR